MIVTRCAAGEHAAPAGRVGWCTDSVQLEHGLAASRAEGSVKWTTLAWPVDCHIHDRNFEIYLGGAPMTRREGTRTDGRDAFLKKLRRYPADRALARVGEGRRGRDFWDLVQYVLANR